MQSDDSVWPPPPKTTEPVEAVLRAASPGLRAGAAALILSTAGFTTLFGLIIWIIAIRPRHLPTDLVGGIALLGTVLLPIGLICGICGFRCIYGKLGTALALLGIALFGTLIAAGLHAHPIK